MDILDSAREAKIVEQLVQWAKHQPLVRAMLLTSSRAVPNAARDIFSDYDVILALCEVIPFYAERSWLEAFGRVLALYRDPLETQDGHPKSGYVIQFENGLKIDFTLWSVEILQKTALEPHLPPEFDAGYRILLDKDHLTDGLKPPTYQAYIPKQPTQAEYMEMIEVFFLEATYVAKYLRRDDVMAAKFILDTFMKHEHLRPMLEWHMEQEHQWSVKPGPYGRRLKQWLRPDLWTDLESTYTGAGLEENWEALDRMMALMRKVAVEVGERLGYVYPNDLEQRTLVFLQGIKNII